MTNDFKKLSDGELVTQVAQLRETVRSLRFGAAGGRNRDTRASRNARKDIARILTETRERAIASGK